MHQGEDFGAGPVTAAAPGEDRRINSAILAAIPATADRPPALIDRACTRLAEARTSAEVLEAKHLGDAALHYAKLTGAANEAQADCIRIITRAEIRLAREIDATQERGEVERAGGDRVSTNVRAADNGPAAIGDLGLDRRRVAEWRDLADAGEQAVDAAIDDAVAEAWVSKRIVTKEAIRRRVATAPKPRQRQRFQEILPDPSHQMAGDLLDFLCRIPIKKYEPAEAASISDPEMVSAINRYFDQAIGWVERWSQAWRERRP